MDTSAKEIDFDEQGVCSFCKMCKLFIRSSQFFRRSNETQKIFEKLKAKRSKNKYDCLIESVAE